MKRKLITVLACVLSAATLAMAANIYDDASAWREACPPELKGNSLVPFVKGNPDLPNALIIGDSISMGYTAEVRDLLVRKMNVYRVPDNAQNTTYTLDHLEQWLDGKKWAVIHCNWGLHDLTSKGPAVDGYGKNLELLIDKLRATGAVVVFATTTPVPVDSIGRAPCSELPYNVKALEVMKRKQVLVDDLHSFAMPILNTIQRPTDVHYSAFGCTMLAQPVARAILAAYRGGEFDDYLEVK